MAARELIILDRDGVINRDSKDFVKSPDEWLPLPGSIEAIARLSKAGYTLAVATNQSGIARGLFDLDTLDAMHNKLRRLVREAGGEVGHIAVCPHGPNDGCDCRKPRPGLFLQISKHYGLPLDGVIAVGDSLRDLQAAAAANARPVLVRTGNGAETEKTLPGEFEGIDVFDSLADAADDWLGG